MEMGYQEASLRVIAAKAETTTGSIYTRFHDKEGLFRALVEETVEPLITWIEEGQNAFAQKPAEEEREEVFTFAHDVWGELVDYLYDHWADFRLLLRCADNGMYETMIGRLVQIEVDYTYRFLEKTRNDALTNGRLSPALLQMLSHAFYAGLFEVISLDMDRGSAHLYVRQLQRFFAQGWTDLLGLKPG